MILKNVSKWGVMVVCFLDMADTLTYWITLLEWQKTSNLIVYTKSQWMTLLWIWIFFQRFSAKFKNENYHPLVDIGICSLHILFWDYWKIWRGLEEKHPSKKGKLQKSHDHQRILTVFSQHSMNCLGYHCYISKMYYCMFLV